MGVSMVETESVSGCKYGGNRERVSVYMEGTERVSGCIYGGNIESEWVYIWWE